MLLFIEDRQEITAAYESYFVHKGIKATCLKSSDIDIWVTADYLKGQLIVEAVLIGNCVNIEDSVKSIRNALDAPIVAILENRSLTCLIDLYCKGIDDVVVKRRCMDECLSQIFTFINSK